MAFVGPAVPRVFVCHHQADAAYAQQMVASLRNLGMDVWLDIDYRGFAGGQRRVVEAELAARSHFILLLSPVALASDWINAQIDAALDLVKEGRMQSFLSVMVEACDPPLLVRRFPIIAGPRQTAVRVAEALPRVQRAIAQPITMRGTMADQGVGNAARAFRTVRRARNFLLLLMPSLTVVLIATFFVQFQRNLVQPNRGGSTYQPYPFADVNMRAIAFGSANDGWIVGDSGSMLTFNGHSWSRYTHSPTTAELDGLFLFPGGAEGWAVGRNGTIIHLSNGAWHTVSSPTTNQLFAVIMTSPTEGWAVGAKATILHYTRGAWQVFASPLSDLHNFLSVAMISPNNGWIAGDTDSLLHFDGQRWNAVESGDLTRSAITFPQVGLTSATTGWLLDQDSSNSQSTYVTRMQRFDGHAWHQTQQFSNVNLTSLVLLSPTSGWALGADYSGGSLAHTVFYHVINNEWSQAQDLGTSEDVQLLRALAMISPTEGWAVGIAGAMLHCHNGTWSVAK